MSECLDPKTCGHSSHVAEAAEPEKFLEVKPVAPIQIETAASRRFDAIAAEKAKRAAEREAVEAAAKAAREAPTPAPRPAPSYEPSAQVKNTQKLLEMIEKRKRVRALLVADKLSRTVEIEGELRQAMKDRDARLEAVEAKAREQLAAIAGAFDDLGLERKAELNRRDAEISKLDKSLDQLAKQLQAEIGKVTGDLGQEA